MRSGVTPVTAQAERKKASAAAIECSRFSSSGSFESLRLLSGVGFQPQARQDPWGCEVFLAVEPDR
jgi:hypothetical protein